MVPVIRKAPGVESAIDENAIRRVLKDAEISARVQIAEILKKARELHGLCEEEVAALLSISDDEQLADLFETAQYVKDAIYGSRVVLFAPLYISNLCSNTCRYCAFRADNKAILRQALTYKEIAEQTQVLLDSGHKRVLLVAGESAATHHLDYICEAIDTIYDTGVDPIRRINVNIAPLDREGFLTLKAHHIGTYQLFQETYHRATYAEVHLKGPKADYAYRLSAMDRAMSAGIGDVGIGVLFGLYDFRFEVLALLRHAAHLEATFGTGPHTISVPRMEPAEGSSIACRPPFPVSDRDISKVIAVLRLAVPYTGIILSTRESAEFRSAALALGVSQMSAGSRTNPGGYGEDGPRKTGAQFELADYRSLDEVVHDSLAAGLIPSFCTACYRRGRTGHDFMDLAKPGLIKCFCHPNALLTLAEYMEDFASPETKKLGQALLERELNEIPRESRKSETVQRLKCIVHGERDLFF